jgi:hypothetical protein
MREPTDSLRQLNCDPIGASSVTSALPRVLLISTLSGLFLGLIGPLDTSSAPLGLRLGYWTGAVLGGGILGWATSSLVMRWRPLQTRLWLAVAVVSLAMTPATTAFVWIWGKLFFGDAGPFNRPFLLIGPVFVICLAMTTIHSLRAPGPAEGNRPETPEDSAAARFIDRLPPRLRGATLLAVEAQDHYLRLHTDRGSDLILLRLSDALAELSGLDGAQTHRSWWVARGAVKDVRRQGGRAILTLSNGLEAPVSRAQAAVLRRAGWF